LEESNKAVGLLDSGVGGLTVAKEIFNLLPGEDIIYYGDTLHLPYGPKKLSLVRKYTEKIVSYLKEEKNVKSVVIACNTATSAALNYLNNKFEIPIFGMIDSAAEKAVEVSKNKKIAVIGTEGTVNSQAYQSAIIEKDPQSSVFSQPCPGFVDLVEEGKFDGAEVENTAYSYLEPLIKAEVDVLILGCTHFPYLMPVLSRVMGDDVTLVNPAEEMAVEVKRELENNSLIKSNYNNLQKNRGEHKFIVSDKDRISRDFLEHGRRFLGLQHLSFEEDNIFAAVNYKGGN